MNTRLIPVMIALAILASTLVAVAAASGFTHHKAFADPWHCGSQTIGCCSVGEHWNSDHIRNVKYTPLVDVGFMLVFDK